MFARTVPNSQGAMLAIGQEVLTDAATETNPVARTLKRPRSGLGVRTATSPAKGTERPAVIKPRGRTAFLQLLCDRLFTRPTDQPRHATKHFTCPVETISPPDLALYGSICALRWHLDDLQFLSVRTNPNTVRASVGSDVAATVEKRFAGFPSDG